MLIWSVGCKDSGGKKTFPEEEAFKLKSEDKRTRKGRVGPPWMWCEVPGRGRLQRRKARDGVKGTDGRFAEYFLNISLSAKDVIK